MLTKTPQRQRCCNLSDKLTVIVNELSICRRKFRSCPMTTKSSTTLLASSRSSAIPTTEEPSHSKTTESSVKLKINQKSNKNGDVLTTRKTRSMKLKSSSITSSTSKLPISIATTKNVNKISSKSNKNDRIYWTEDNDRAIVTLKHFTSNATSSSTKSDTSDHDNANKNCNDFYYTNLRDVHDVYYTVEVIVRGNPLPLRRHRTSRGYVYNPSASAQEIFKVIVKEQINNITNRITAASSSSSRTMTSNSTGSSSDMNNTTATAITLLTAATTTATSGRAVIITDDDDFKPTVQTGTDTGEIFPLFGINRQIAMSVIFRMKRPRNHFVSSKAGPGRLKDMYCNTTNESTSAGNSNVRILPSTTIVGSDVDNLAKFVLDSLNGVLYVDDKQIVSLHVVKLYDDYCSGIDNCCLGSTQISIRAIDTVYDLNEYIQTSTGTK